MDLLRILIAVLLLPLGVFLQVGIGKHFWINILLTILGFIRHHPCRMGHRQILVPRSFASIAKVL